MDTTKDHHALGRIEKILMPNDDFGRRPPNPFRYACGLGHVHPSERHALYCRMRYRKNHCQKCGSKLKLGHVCGGGA